MYTINKFAILLLVSFVALFAFVSAHGGERILDLSAHDLRSNRRAPRCADGQFHTFVHHNPPVGTNLGIIGDVQDVLNGIVKAGVAEHYYDARDFKAALGAATPRSTLSSTGEAFMVNGNEYTLSTDPNDHYYTPITGRYFKTQFSVGIQKNAEPDLSVAYTRSISGAEGDVTLNTIYANTYKALGGRAFCYAGIVKYRTFSAIGGSAPPIQNECLTCHPEKYYSQPPTLYTNVNAVTAGCAANYSSIPAALGTQLRRVLYTNPLDPVANAALQVHSHSVVIDDSITRLQDVYPHNVRDIKHMVSTSTIEHFNIQVYAVNGLEDIDPVRRH